MRKTPIIIGISLILSTGICFATPSSTETPIVLSQGATPYHFTITEAVKMTGEGDSVDLDVTPIKITNDSGLGAITFSLKADGEGNYKLKPLSTKWEDEVIDSNTFGISVDGFDLASGEYKSGKIISSHKDKNTDEETFTGKAAITSKNISGEKVGAITATISWKKSQLF